MGGDRDVWAAEAAAPPPDPDLGKRKKMMTSTSTSTSRSTSMSTVLLRVYSSNLHQMVFIWMRPFQTHAFVWTKPRTERGTDTSIIFTCLWAGCMVGHVGSGVLGPAADLCSSGPPLKQTGGPSVAEAQEDSFNSVSVFWMNVGCDVLWAPAGLHLSPVNPSPPWFLQSISIP